MPVQIHFTVVDKKGARSMVRVNAKDGRTVAEYTAAAQQLLTVLKKLITGAVVSAGLCIDVGLTGLQARSDAGANSDVEEGGKFIFAAGQYNTSMRIPTFDEAQVVPGSSLINLQDTDVAEWTTLIREGAKVGQEVVQFTDYRGEDIDGIQSARESFQRSRR